MISGRKGDVDWLSRFRTPRLGSLHLPFQRLPLRIRTRHLDPLWAPPGPLSVTFVSDGAPWIWDRVPQVVAKAKLDQVQIYEVLDCGHAAHDVSLALAASKNA
jgi:hypothetical protein